MKAKLKAGDEAESYCTKCKTVLNHRIVAMVASTPARVECLTCNSLHNYRAKAPGEKASSTASGKEPKVRTVSLRGKAALEEKRLQTERELEKRWEHAVSGKPSTAFKSFRSSESYQVGELVKHTKFGEGVVTEIVDAGAIVVLFREQTKTLAQGIPSF